MDNNKEIIVKQYRDSKRIKLYKTLDGAFIVYTDNDQNYWIMNATTKKAYMVDGEASARVV